MNKIVSLLVSATLVALVTGCDKDPAPATPVEQAKGTAQADPLLVNLAPAMLGSIKVAPVQQGEVRAELRFASRASVDEQRVARIGATVTGRVSQINAVLGQDVSKGMVLATLNSTELGGAQLTYLKALTQLQLQERAVERARMLLEAEVIGSAELLKREAELTAARAEMNSSADQLKVLGMSTKAVERLAATADIDSASHVTTSLSGTVIARTITRGQVVQPADTLFTVVDLSHVWIVAEVPEQQADLISEGEEVQVEIPALQNRRFTGRLIYVGDTVNPETRTVTVRTDIDNRDRSIKPDMLANMLVRGKSHPQSVVPASAVIREGDKDHIFVQTGAGQFRLRPVTLGDEGNGVRPVVAGLQAGEQIVIDGAFHLNNERKRKELEE